jgi:hypothetical protein
VLQTSAVLAASPEIKPAFDVRLRWEDFDTPARSAAADRTYDLYLARARFGLDAGWQHWKLHGMVQASGSFDLPVNPAFAAGTNYISANDGDRNPSQIGIAELRRRPGR